MTKYGHATRNNYKQRIWLPILIGLIIIFVTIFIFWGLLLQEQAQINRNVELAATTISQGITTQIKNRINALERMAQRWEVSNGTPQAEWEADATNYWQDYPGFQALEWVDKSYNSRWVVPLKGNQVAKNSSVSYDKIWRNSLEKAKALQETTITPNIDLIRGYKIFLLSVPLFWKDSQLNLQQNIENNFQNNFDGFIVATLRTQQLLDAILDNNFKRQYAIRIFQGNEQIYISNINYQNSYIEKQWTHRIKINLKDVTWEISISPLPTLLKESRSFLPQVVLGAGLTMALLLALVVYLRDSSQLYAQQLETSNGELLREIKERQQVEAALKQYVAEVEDLYNNAPCGYHSLNKEGIFVRINDTELKWLGYTREEIIGKRFTDFLTPEYSSGFYQEFPNFLDRGWIRDVEIELVCKNGTILPVVLNATAVKDATGNFLMTRSTVFDLCERKLAEEVLRESEERFRGAFEFAAIGMALVSTQGRWLKVNLALCQMIGYSQEELLSSNFQAITHPDDLEIDLNYLHQLLAGEIPCYDMEKRYINKQGHIVWILLSVSLVRNSHGLPLYFVAQIQDITARKEAESELRWREALLRSMANASPLAFFVEDENTNEVLYFNHRFCQMWDIRCTQEEIYQGKLIKYPLVGCADCQPNSNERLAAFRQVCQPPAITEDKVVVEDELELDDGRVLRRFSTQIRDKQDKYLGRLYIFEDISNRREIERLKDEFVSIVSHELRTPLTSIRGSLGLVANGVLHTQPEKAQRMLSIAVNNTDRLIRLINDILDIERIESGKVQLTKQICNVSTLMTQSADVMRTMAEKSSINLSVTPISADLCADPDRIIQTLTNLLSNAIKFSEPGSTVHLTAEVENRPNNLTPYLLLKVKDQGRGIPPDKLESIFERFQQVDASDARKKGGTGLGLAICRSIVQHHDGQIWVESTLDKGSTFYVALPLPSKQQPLVIPTNSHAPLVLVCDDDPDACTLLEPLLKKLGYQTIWVTSATDAVQEAGRQQPDVILLNLIMPDMDSWETLAALKQQSQTQDIPVIILSRLMPNAKASECKQISNWIVKPDDEKLLIQALERVICDQRHEVKVLVVEDDLDLAHVLIAIFERYGVQTYHAQTGREAIEMSQKLLPNLLVLDLKLPEIDGFAVVDWLRQHNQLRTCPLVVYCAQDLSEGDRQQLNLGETVFLTKGRVTPEEFEKRVITLLKRIIP